MGGELYLDADKVEANASPQSARVKSGDNDAVKKANEALG